MVDAVGKVFVGLVAYDVDATFVAEIIQFRQLFPSEDSACWVRWRIQEDRLRLWGGLPSDFIYVKSELLCESIAERRDSRKGDRLPVEVSGVGDEGLVPPVRNRQ